MEDGEINLNTEGTPQGASISILLSNLCLHYVLDLWITKLDKIHLQGEAYLVRYIDDFVICFQYRSDAIRVQQQDHLIVLSRMLKRWLAQMMP